MGDFFKVGSWELGEETFMWQDMLLAFMGSREKYIRVLPSQNVN